MKYTLTIFIIVLFSLSTSLQIARRRVKHTKKCSIERIIVPLGSASPIYEFSFPGQRNKITLTMMNKKLLNDLIVDRELFYSDKKTNDLWYASIVIRDRIYNKYRKNKKDSMRIGDEMKKGKKKYEKYKEHLLPNYIKYKLNNE